MKKQVYNKRYAYARDNPNYRLGSEERGYENVVFKEFLRQFLGEENLISDGRVGDWGRQIFHHPESSTTLLCEEHPGENTITAYGTEQGIKEVERGLVVRIRQLELSKARTK